MGQVTALGDRMHVLSLPMKFHPGHVNAYVLEDDEGLTLVDTGNSLPDTRQCWERLLASPLARRGVKRVVLTHGHPDHSGHAEWLCRTTGAELWLTAPELDAVRRLWRGSALQIEAVKAFFLQWGLPEDQFPPVQALLESFRSGTSDLDVPLQLIGEGDVLTTAGVDWQIKSGFGHTPENATLWQRELGLLISGDQLLPRIVPNISVWWGSSTNPLQAYLDSLHSFEGLGEVAVLPAHGTVFGDLDARIEQIRQFHFKRLLRALKFCRDEPRTAFECIRPVLGKTEGGDLISLIIGQVFALLAYLEGAGLMEKSGEDVFRFRTLGGAEARLAEQYGVAN